MESSKDITHRAFTILAFFFMVGTSVLIVPAGLAEAAKQDSWLAAIVGIGLNVGFAALYVLLAERHAGRTLVQIGELLLGRWIGKLLGAFFASFCFVLASLMVGDMGYFLTSQILVDTPMEPLLIMFVCAIALTVRKGMKGFSYAAEIFFPWIVLLLVLFIIPMMPDFDGRRMMPFMEYGPVPILKGGVSFFAFQELVVLLMIYPSVKAGKGKGKGFLIGTALGGLVLILTTLGSIGVLGSDLTANHLYPAYTMAKNIKIGRFLERIEGIMIFIWICSIFVKITLTFHASLLAFSEALGVKDLRALLWPCAIGLVVMALLCYPNVFFIRKFLSTSWLPYASIFLVIMPLLYLMVSFFRGKTA
ncbi:GerAB/ArcD/ProY family transporter [Cohnella nanjingensis]|uniref:Endospore germination permease n=1 Tax=Cohnella nanjingensis TaxID=1387779 RepID=A0A7X0VHZ3_9BACL|nr:endospore germination permease [Cohnella nanjingensis]MBB6674665.1 endospore germination permease [Cohnella nanjingensis]